MIKKKHEELLVLFGKLQMIKIEIAFHPENIGLMKILKDDYNKEELMDFFFTMYTDGYLKLAADISLEDYQNAEYLSAIIDWEKIRKTGLISDSNPIINFMINRPNTFDLFTEKSQYFSTLEYFQFVETAQIVNVLDEELLKALILNKQYACFEDKEDKIDIKELYMNLLFNVFTVPIKTYEDKKLFSPSYYNTIVKENTGVSINIMQLQELHEVYKKSLEEEYNKKTEYTTNDDIIPMDENIVHEKPNICMEDIYNN